MSFVSKFEWWADSARRNLSRPSVYLSLIIAALLVLFLGNITADPDLFARMAVGRFIVETGVVAQHDPFAYTQKFPLWYDHEWLSGYIFYHLWLWGGGGALFVFKCLIAALSIYILSLAQRVVATRKELIPLWAGFAVYNSAIVWISSVRSQVFTYLFIPILLLALVSFEKRGEKRWLWLLPPMMFIWANSHGGFVVGLGFLGLSSVCACFYSKQPLWPIALSFVLCLLAPFLNPYGPGYLLFVSKAVTMSRPSITEWMYSSPFAPSEVPFYLMLLVLSLGLWRARFQISISAGLMLLLSAYFGIRHVRLIPVFAMVASVYGTDYFALVMDIVRERFSRWYEMTARAASAVAIFALPVLLAILAVFFLQIKSFSLDTSKYPVKAFDWLLSSEAHGRLLVDFNRGSYALWRLYPKFLISIDGRYEEVYPDSSVADVSTAMNPRDPEQAASFNRVKPTHILLDRGDSADELQKVLGTGWNRVYQDDQFVILSEAQNG